MTKSTTYITWIAAALALAFALCACAPAAAFAATVEGPGEALQAKELVAEAALETPSSDAPETSGTAVYAEQEATAEQTVVEEQGGAQQEPSQAEPADASGAAEKPAAAPAEEPSEDPAAKKLTIAYKGSTVVLEVGRSMTVAELLEALGAKAELDGEGLGADDVRVSFSNADALEVSGEGGTAVVTAKAEGESELTYEPLGEADGEDPENPTDGSPDDGEPSDEDPEPARGELAAETVAVTRSAVGVSSVVYAESSTGWLTVGERIGYDDYATNVFFSGDGYYGYCATPSRPTPDEDNYYKASLADVYEGAYDPSSVAKVLYYGYGGPGFNPSMWPTYYYDGSAMTAEIYMALTHVLVADRMYTDSEAAFYRTSDEFKYWFAWYVQGQDWWTETYCGISGGNDNGTYRRMQDAWAALSSTEQQAYIRACYAYYTGDDTQVIAFAYPDRPVGYVKITKASANSTITAGYSQYKTSGAVFGVYNSSGTQVATLTTGSDGIVTSGTLVTGSYTIRELTAPQGYYRNTGSWTVTVNSGATSSLTVSDTPITGFVNLNKRSGNTGITAGNPNYSLAGAIYGVYTNAACTTLARDINGNQVILTTDANGNTQSSGQLRYGTYYMKEISPSPGYDIDNSVYTVSITTGTVTITVYETPHTDPMTFIKVDKDLYDAATWSLSDNKPQGSATLAGAEFTVYYFYEHYNSIADIIAAAESAAGNTFEAVADALAFLAVRTWVFATDDRGYADVTDDYFVRGDSLYRKANGDPTIPIGTMAVYESKAPHGYIKPDPVESAFHITWITETDDADTFIAKDEVVSNEVDGLKRDIDDKTPIADTEFTLWRLATDCVTIDDDNVLYVVDGTDLEDMGNWILVGTWFTDAHGVVDFGKLPIGFYRLLETHPPASGQYMSSGETHEGGQATTRLYPVYFKVDSTSNDSVQVIENRRIQIEATIRKKTIIVTSIGFAYADDKYNAINNTGTEKMRYDIDYDAGNSNTYADEYWMIDNCDFAQSPYDIRITDLYLPVVSGDTDGELWLLIRTNLTDLMRGTAYGMTFTQPELHPGTLCDGTARFTPVGWDYWGKWSATSREKINLADMLKAGEYITGICIVHGAVESRFCTTTPLSYLVVATHVLAEGTVIPNSASVHTSRNWSSVVHTPAGDVPKTPGGLKDDDYTQVKTTVVSTFTTSFQRGLGEWASGYSYGHRYQTRNYYTRTYNYRAVPQTGDELITAAGIAAGAALGAAMIAMIAAAALAIARKREQA